MSTGPSDAAVTGARPGTVTAALLVAYVLGIAFVAGGARGRSIGEDLFGGGIGLLLDGLVILAAAVAAQRGSRLGRAVAVVAVTLGTAVAAQAHAINLAVRLVGLLTAAVVVVLLVFPAPSRRWFGDEEPRDADA